MPTIKLVLEYDGTCYSGWQRQANQPTIQEAIERAILQVSQATVSIIGAGRTDSGVHALGQVASFRADCDWSASNWMRALNAVLPKDIAVCSSALMDDRFHAQHDARGKLYIYRILHRPARPTVDRAFVWHIYRLLNETAMQQAAATLIGSQDFSSFEGSLTDNTNPICHLQRLAVVRQDDEIHIEAYADRFLKHMVRAIVGTVVEVGLGKRNPDSLPGVLQARDRSAAGQTAPPHGLCLMRVDYDEQAAGKVRTFPQATDGTTTGDKP
jgi:tRNA pseudouridine38-40 synthase